MRTGLLIVVVAATLTACSSSGGGKGSPTNNSAADQAMYAWYNRVDSDFNNVVHDADAVSGPGGSDLSDLCGAMQGDLKTLANDPPAPDPNVRTQVASGIALYNDLIAQCLIDNPTSNDDNPPDATLMFNAASDLAAVNQRLSQIPDLGN